MYTIMNRTAHSAKIRRSEGKTLGTSNFLSIALSAVFVGLSALLVINSAKSLSTAYQRNLLLDQAKSEVQDLRVRNLELMQELDYVSSSAYVEEEARNRLLYAKNSEVLILLPQISDKSDDTVISEDVTAEDEKNDPNGWGRWWNFLRDGV